MRRTITIGLVILALACGSLRESDRDATMRQNLAASWESPSADFAAIGMNNRTLYAAIPDADSVGCDAFVDSIITDKPMVESLRTQGFREISCGERETPL
jgi:hypothetical protein